MYYAFRLAVLTVAVGCLPVMAQPVTSPVTSQMLLEGICCKWETEVKLSVKRYYHQERNHQGKDNLLLFPVVVAEKSRGAIRCRELLGGLLKYYSRAA
jgi:hypothetical protein